MSAMSAALSAAPGGAQARRRDGAAAMQQIFADGEAEAGLLLVAGERQIGIEEVLGAVEIAAGGGAADVDHHLGSRSRSWRRRRRAPSPRQEQAAIADEDGEAPADAASASRRRLILESPGQSSCFSMTTLGSA